jgi:hypothetical protein
VLIGADRDPVNWSVSSKFNVFSVRPVETGKELSIALRDLIKRRFDRDRVHAPGQPLQAHTSCVQSNPPSGAFIARHGHESLIFSVTNASICIFENNSVGRAVAPACVCGVAPTTLWIVPCLEGATPTPNLRVVDLPQDMLLAARALGLGATLTTLHLQFEKEAEAALDG